MIPKPSSCMGCPFYSHSKHYVPDTIVQDSEVMFIAQNPGADEEAGHRLVKRHWQGSQYIDEKEQVQPQPLIGSTGDFFNRKFLPLTGLRRSEVSLGNAIRCRPGTSLGLKPNGLPIITSKMRLEHSNADIVNALKHCREAHLHIPSTVKLIVAMGRYALFSLTGIQNEESEYDHKQGVMESWRGYAVDHDYTTWRTVNTNTYHSLQSSKRIMFTMHLAILLREKGNDSELQKRWYHATLQDFNKIKRLLQGSWPLQLPQWHSMPPVTWPKYAAFDTEYIPDGNQLIRWSLCDTQNNLYCVEADDTDVARIPIERGSTVLIQNALADIGHLSNIVDMRQVNIEDMMLAHSVLWTGEPHNLNYIASKYGAFNRYKHLSHDNPQLYSALDAYEPMHMWRTHFIPEFKNDHASWNIYKKYRLPLVNIIDKAQRSGAKVDTSRLTEVQRILQQRLHDLQAQAQQITGDPKFNLGGRKAMMEALYD